MSNPIHDMALHQKLDILREQQWDDMVTMQQEQIRLLTQLLQERQQSTGQTP